MLFNMKTATIRQMHNDLSDVLAWVSEGEEVAVLNRSRPVASRPYDAPCEVVRLDLPCSPCYRYSVLGICCGNRDYLACLRRMDVNPILDAIRGIL